MQEYFRANCCSGKRHYAKVFVQNLFSAVGEDIQKMGLDDLLDSMTTTMMIAEACIALNLSLGSPEPASTPLPRLVIMET